MHRDIKPDNILATSSDLTTAQVKLADFGVSRALELTRSCTFKGTLMWMDIASMNGTPTQVC